MKGYELYTLYEQINEENDLGVDPWELLNATDHKIWDDLAALVKEA